MTMHTIEELEKAVETDLEFYGGKLTDFSSNISHTITGYDAENKTFECWSDTGMTLNVPIGKVKAIRTPEGRLYFQTSKNSTDVPVTYKVSHEGHTIIPEESQTIELEVPETTNTSVSKREILSKTEAFNPVDLKDPKKSEDIRIIHDQIRVYMLTHLNKTPNGPIEQMNLELKYLKNLVNDINDSNFDETIAKAIKLLYDIVERRVNRTS